MRRSVPPGWASGPSSSCSSPTSSPARSTRSSPSPRRRTGDRARASRSRSAARPAAACAAGRSTPARPEGWFVGTAGLKIVCPGTVEDAYGLLRAAIDDPDPVLYFEHKRLYRTLRADAPPAGHRTPIGPAAIARAGSGRDGDHLRLGRLDGARGRRARRRGRRDRRPAHDLAARRADDPLLDREDLARPRAPGGVSLDRRRRGDPVADRPTLVRAPRRASRLCTPRPTRRCRSRPSSRTRTCRRSSRRPPPSTSCSPTDADRALRGGTVGRLRRARRALPARPAAAPLRGSRDGAVPAGAHPGLGLHGPRAGGGRRGRRARARPGRRRRAAQSRARLPLRRGATPADVFRNFFGKATSPTFGRDGNMHFGAPARGVFPLVSMLGDLVPLVAGAALAFKRRGERRVAMTFLGEGAFSVGDTHEGLNLAAVWQVPAVFVIQSNRYSYSTPVARQMVNTNIAQRMLRRLVDSRRARRRNRRPRRPRRRARCRRAGPQRQRPPGRRGPLGADARPRRPRRRALRAGRDARGVRGAVRPGRTARSTPRARRLRISERFRACATLHSRRSMRGSPRPSRHRHRIRRRSRTASTRRRRF